MYKNIWHRQLKVTQTQDVIKLKTAYFNWLSKINWNIEINLSRDIDWTYDEAVKAANLFGSHLDKNTFGKSRRRYGKSLERWLTIEYATPIKQGNNIKKNIKDSTSYARWHLHGFVKIPENNKFSYIKLKKIIIDSWSKTNSTLFGDIDLYKHCEIGPLYDQSTWLNYIQKQCDNTGDIHLLNASHLNVI